MLPYLRFALVTLLICSFHRVSANEIPKLYVPDEWVVEKSNGYTQIISPEQDVSVYFLKFPAITRCQNASQTAWKKVNPTFNLKIQQEIASPLTNGWDETCWVYYDTPASEFRTVFSYMHVIHHQAYLSLVDGSTAGLSRRGAEVSAAIMGWLPKDYKEPDLSQNPAKNWTTSDRQEFDNFVRTAMQSLNVPGASIAIVRKGKIIYSNAFGLKRIDSTDAVKTDTLFMIGSMTKPLTTLMMAKLVDNKVLSWHTPIIELLPDFQLADLNLTKNLELWHTVCACTGMPRRDYDFIFNFNGIEPEQRILELKKIQPTTDLGKTFQYSNDLVAAGGYAAAHAYDKQNHLAQAYNTAMKNLVFVPLKMKHTVINVDEALTMDIAMPHAPDIYNKMQIISLKNESSSVYSLSPAGGIWSTAEDIARYMLLELNKGTLADSKMMVSEAELLRRRIPVIKMNNNSYYGIGLLIKKEQGLELIGHSGGLLGYSSDFFIIPEKQYGMVILTNTNGRNGFPFISAVKQKFKELTFRAEPASNKIVELAVQQNKEATEKLLKQISMDPKDLSRLTPLIGEYTNSDLGSIRLFAEQSGFKIDFNGTQYQVGLIEEDTGDKLLVITSPPWSGTLKFLIQKNGTSLIMDGGQIKYVFTRKNQ